MAIQMHSPNKRREIIMGWILDGNGKYISEKQKHNNVYFGEWRINEGSVC
jgi:hypothetical protein